MLKSKRYLSIFLAFCISFTLFPGSAILKISAEVQPASQCLYIFAKDINIDDSNFVDTVSDPSCSDLFDYFGRNEEQYKNSRKIPQGQFIIYKLDLPDNCYNISFGTFGSMNGKIEISTDEKATWKILSNQMDGDTYSVRNTYSLPSNNFLDHDMAKTFYLKISTSNDKPFYYASLDTKYIIFGNEPKNFDITPTTHHFYAFCKDQNIDDSGFIDTVSDSSVKGLFDYWGRTEDQYKNSRKISQGQYIIYRFDLPDNSYNVSLGTFGTMNGKIEISKDQKSTWTSLTNRMNGVTYCTQNDYTLPYNSFLDNDVTKTFYLKISSADTQPFYYATFDVKFSLFNNNSVQPTSQCFYTFCKDQNIDESGFVDSVSDSSVMNLFDYWGRTEDQYKNSRKISQGQYIIYKLNLPNNSYNISFGNFGTVNGKLEISIDNKATWTTLINNMDGSTYSVRNSYSLPNNSLLDNNASKTFYLKISSSDAQSFYYSSFDVKYYVIGVETEDLTIQPTSQEFYVFCEDQNINDSSFIDSASDSSVWNLFDYWGRSEDQYKNSRKIPLNQYIIYRFDLPDNCTDISFGTFGTMNGKFEISADEKATWSTLINNKDGVTYSVRNSYLLPNNSFFDNYTTKTFYLKISTSNDQPFYYASFDIKYNESITEQANIKNTYSSLIYADTVEEGGRLLDNGSSSISTFSSVIKQRNVSSGDSVTYLFNLPDNTADYSIKSYINGNYTVYVSNDNSNWSILKQGSSSWEDVDFGGISSILQNNSDKNVYVKIVPNSTALSFIRLEIKFSPTVAFAFNGSMSEGVLRNYASRAVTLQGLCAEGVAEDFIFEDDLRMLQHTGTKFVGLAAFYSWSGNMTASQINNHYAIASQKAALAHKADPEIILQAGVYEIIYKETVNNTAIPAWVFEAFDQPVVKRNFNWYDMQFPSDSPYSGAFWGSTESAVPNIAKTETQMYFYYSVCRYIDAGYEAVHLGQSEMMMGYSGNTYSTYWDTVTTKAREYAKLHARRGLVLFSCHDAINSGGIKVGNRLVMDMQAAAIVPNETTNSNGALMGMICDYSVDNHWLSWIGRSDGGEHPLGFTIEHNITIIEFDNYGGNGQHGVPTYDSFYNWGYDDITWFTVQPEWYRNQFLLESNSYLKTHDLDSGGNQVYFLQMPMRRLITPAPDFPTITYTPGWYFNPDFLNNYALKENMQSVFNGNNTYTLTITQYYQANTNSDSCPNGFGQEEIIRQMFLG